MHESAFVASNATIIGDVTVKANASIWHGAVLRGDLDSIVIGKEANVQDNAVLHSEPDCPTHVGEQVTIGHGAVVHGCTIGEKSVIGMNSCVLDNAEVGDHSIVASGAVVKENQSIPSQVMATGTPAEVKKEIEKDSFWLLSGEFYVDLADRYKEEN